MSAVFEVCVEKIFSDSVVSLFTLLIIFCAEKKSFSMNLSYLLILAFISCTMILLRMSGPKPTCWRFGPNFSSIWFRVSDLISRS